MSACPFVEMNAICRPSGENTGPWLIPLRSTIVRGSPPPAATAYTRVSYGAENPLRGAAEYAISRPSGDHEKPST